MSVDAVKIAEETKRLLEDHFRDRFKTYRRTPMVQIQGDDLPVLGVYVLRERRRTDGDVNAGPPTFINEVTIGISGSVRNEEDEEQNALDLESWMDEADDVLFTNPGWVMMTEGVLSTDRLAQYAKDGEISMAEIRVEMVLQFRSRFEPVIPDILEVVHVKTVFPLGASQEDQDKVQQVVAEYDIPTT